MDVWTYGGMEGRTEKGDYSVACLAEFGRIDPRLESDVLEALRSASSSLLMFLLAISDAYPLDGEVVGCQG